MAFHEVLFPEDISYGSSGGPGFNTTVIELSSGHEQRNINWSQARARYDVSHGVKTREQMEELLDFFWARRGRAFGFRFKDWSDFRVEQEVIGVGNGVTKVFQMRKTYEPQGYPIVRTIRKINPGTLQVWRNDVLLVAGTSYTVDNNTGLITILTTPPTGAVIKAACEFHVPVRFDIDDMKITHDAWETMTWPSIELVEVKPRLADGTIVE